MHCHAEADEALYVIEGELLVHIDDVEHHVGTGGFSFAPRGVPHAFTVTSPTARILTIQTRGWGRPSSTGPATSPSRPHRTDRSTSVGSARQRSRREQPTSSALLPSPRHTETVRVDASPVKWSEGRRRCPALVGVGQPARIGDAGRRLRRGGRCRRRCGGGGDDTVSGGLVVGVAVPPPVGCVFTVVGVPPPTGFGGGVSLPFTLWPLSLVNVVGRQSPGCTGACPSPRPPSTPAWPGRCW